MAELFNSEKLECSKRNFSEPTNVTAFNAIRNLMNKWKHKFPTGWWLQILKFCSPKLEIKETKMESEPWFESDLC